MLSMMMTPGRNGAHLNLTARPAVESSQRARLGGRLSETKRVVFYFSSFQTSPLHTA